MLSYSRDGRTYERADIVDYSVSVHYFEPAMTLGLTCRVAARRIFRMEMNAIRQRTRGAGEPVTGGALSCPRRPRHRRDRRHGVVVTGRPAAAAAGPTWTWDRVGRGCDLCSARRDCDTARHCTTPRRASFGRRGTPGRNHSDARPAPRPRRHPPRRRHRGRPTVSRWRHCAPAHSS
jgi:hypothetical protein